MGVVNIPLAVLLMYLIIELLIFFDFVTLLSIVLPLFRCLFSCYVLVVVPSWFRSVYI